MEAFFNFMYCAIQQFVGRTSITTNCTYSLRPALLYFHYASIYVAPLEINKDVDFVVQRLLNLPLTSCLCLFSRSPRVWSSSMISNVLNTRRNCDNTQVTDVSKKTLQFGSQRACTRGGAHSLCLVKLAALIRNQDIYVITIYFRQH